MLPPGREQALDEAPAVGHAIRHQDGKRRRSRELVQREPERAEPSRRRLRSLGQRELGTSRRGIGPNEMSVTSRRWNGSLSRNASERRSAPRSASIASSTTSAPGPTLNTVAPDASDPARGLPRSRRPFRPATSVSPAGSRRSAVTMPTGSSRNPCEGAGAPCSSRALARDGSPVGVPRDPAVAVPYDVALAGLHARRVLAKARLALERELRSSSSSRRGRARLRRSTARRRKPVPWRSLMKRSNATLLRGPCRHSTTVRRAGRARSAASWRSSRISPSSPILRFCIGFVAYALVSGARRPPGEQPTRRWQFSPSFSRRPLTTWVAVASRPARPAWRSWYRRGRLVGGLCRALFPVPSMRTPGLSGVPR